jgi:hypothetical protein
MIDEKKWVQAANEWIIAYTFAQQGMLTLDFSGYVTGPPLFLLGHALELYLKACLVRRGEQPWGHELFDMWKTLKLDPAFIREINISQRLFDTFDLGDSGQFYKEPFSLQHQMVIMLMKYTADLKYLGTKMKKVQGGGYSYGWLSFDPAVAKVFNGLRKYVSLPDGHLDSLTAILAEPELPPSQREFIQNITS